MDSTRFPGKVLTTIGEKTLLELMYSRVSKSQKLDAIIVVTSSEKADDVLEAFCQERGIQCFRGSEWDVLDRFYRAIQSLEEEPAVIVRMTGDCTLHHGKVVDLCLEKFETREVDYFSNSNNEPDFLEDGFDVEVFTFEALKTAWQEAELLSEREHVTPYIKNCGQFSLAWEKCHPDYIYKLSVDTHADYKAVNEIFQRMGNTMDFSIEEVVTLLQENPEILELNQESMVNAGYAKSLANDRVVS